MAPGGAGHEPGDRAAFSDIISFSWLSAVDELSACEIYEHIQNQKSGGTSGAQSARIHADSEQGSFRKRNMISCLELQPITSSINVCNNSKTCHDCFAHGYCSQQLKSENPSPKSFHGSSDGRMLPPIENR